MKSQFKKEDAVSPVVGVMLMLVVTIIIAAVVAMFSTGLVDNTTPTPAALIGVSGSNSQDGTIVFLHKGGDDFDIRDVTLILSRGEGSSPVEYTYSDNTYSIKSLDGDSTISAGEYFAIGPIRLAGSGDGVEYSLLQNGHAITSGKLVIPEGVVSQSDGIVTLGISGGKDLDEWNCVTTYITSTSHTASIGELYVFYVNGFDSSNENINGVKPAASLIVEKDGMISTVRYDATYFGYPITFTSAGTYEIHGKLLSGMESTKHYTADGYPYSSDYTAYADGGTITVTVN